LRIFWLTLFAIGAAGVLAFGWQDGVPFTAAAFVIFFASRVWRSVIKRPLTVSRAGAMERANRETGSPRSRPNVTADGCEVQGGSMSRPAS
jgi:hypothetical protein